MSINDLADKDLRILQLKITCRAFTMSPLPSKVLL